MTVIQKSSERYNWPFNDNIECDIVPQTKLHVLSAPQKVSDFYSW